MRSPALLPPHSALAVCLFCAAISLQLCSHATAFEPDSEEFFEQKIRPVLVKHCYECHSDRSEEIGGSLWLDSAGGMMEGGDSGPAIRPGDAEASLLVSAIRYESSEMPPDQPLPPEVIADFVKWINAGAKDPRISNPTTHRKGTDQEIDLDRGREFWAFRPIKDFRAESAADRSLGNDSLIDQQINAALRRDGIRPNGQATPETRLRRLAFDLTGLPPDESIRQRWLSSPDESTWTGIVDQLLASRAFAQHWARHWMDLARYADSNGSDFNATFHDAWRYRDYLVDSFDSDRPLDEMIRQQIAGDLLPAETDQQRYDNVVATTFLMLGPKMLSERAKEKLILDVVDEQIDTIGRAFLGMTLGCARCHDHKFDPIPTEDYYALAGIFRSTQTLNGESQKYVSTWNRVELPTSDEHRRSLKDHQSQLSSHQKQIKEAQKKLDEAKSNQNMRLVVDDSDATKTGPWVSSTYTKGYVGSGYVHDDNANKGECSIEFRLRLPDTGRYTVRFAFNTSSNRAAKVPVSVLTADGEEQLIVNQQTKLKTHPWRVIGEYSFSAEQDAVVTVHNQGTDGYVIADAVQFIPVDAKEQPAESDEATKQIAAAQADLDALKKQLSELKKNTPPPIPVAMAPRDFSSDKISDSHVHIRGEVKNLGDVIPRGFLQVCGPADASIESPQGSGRVELARWLTDPDHPLVARVLVNRVWMHLLGEGIVRSVDNFGIRGDRPSHPELLDALAVDFMRDGWRLKPLIRRVVLSETYNRSSAANSDSAAGDPENRLLWRAHRKRLTAESIRDTMLASAGLLADAEPVEPVAGKGVLVTKNSGDTKAVASGISHPVRSLYLPVIRSNIDPLMAALDSADPDMLVGKRPTTNVPGQALVLLNSEFVVGWSEKTADRIHGLASDWDDRMRLVYQTCLSREPTDRDLEIASHYMGQRDELSEAESKQRFRDFVAAVFASTEFRLLD